MRISDWSSDVCSSDLLARSSLRLDTEVAAQPLLDLAIERKGITAASHERKGTQQVPMRTFPVGVDRYRALREHKEFRSEERRVGKECVSPCRSRWAPAH